MGKKTRVRKIQIMKGQLFFFFAVLGLSQMAFASAELSLRYLYEDAPDRLTTEKIWVLDPAELNPHRQNWVLERQLELSGLRAIETQARRYTVQTTGIQSRNKGYYRGPGPWYQTPDKFGCEKIPVSWFTTEAGAQRALKTAKNIWETILKDHRVKLELALGSISESTPLAAQYQAWGAFEKWKAELDYEWRNTGKAQVRRDEWDSYWIEARVAQICKDGLEKDSPQPAWESLMELPPLSTAVQLPQVVARAPARRWEGLFSIRAMVHVGGRKLSGQFLLDSTLRTSVISPSFLKSQGVEVATLVEPRSRPVRVNWSNGGGVGVPIQIDHLDISGLNPRLRRFFAVETELFSPPDSVSTCCDGILGADFFRNHVLEFRQEPLPVVLVWSRSGFWFDGPWVEVSWSPEGYPVSGCQVTRQDDKSGPVISLDSVRWDTASDSTVELNPELRKIPKDLNIRWKLQCPNLVIAADIAA
ncbi:MAG: hypothetical protein AABZ55_11775, partial [Bdellovibrionota bacterium]